MGNGNSFNTGDVTDIRLEESAALSRGERYRFQEQCFLHFWKANIFAEWVSLKRYPLSLHVGRTSPDNKDNEFYRDYPEVMVTTCPDGKISTCEAVYSHQHISSIISETPSTVVNTFNNLDGADLFFSLDSSILTQLKPEIRLYKIYPSVGETSNKTSHEKRIRHKILMPLGENIRAAEEGMPSSKTGMSSIENLFYDHGVLGNVMLTDLSFKFAGKNVALLNTVENVRFTLSFSSFNLFNHLFKQTVYPDDEKTTVDESEVVEWSYKDLISYSNRFLRKNNSTNTPIDSPSLATDISCYTSGDKFIENNASFDLGGTPNSEFFEIQMAIRYNPDDIDWDMFGTAAYGTGDQFITKKTYNKKKKKWIAEYNESQERLKSFLRNSTIMLRLQFAAHTIKYNAKSSGADPELLIDFEYKAYIEGVLNDPELDIFNLGGEEGVLVDAENNLARARRTLEAVKREQLTLGAIFGQDGKNKSAAAASYNKLRGFLENNAGVLSYLIWNPNKMGKMKNIIPTDKHLDKAESESKAKSKRMTEQFVQVRRGLKFDPKNLETALNDTGNAVAVFQEMVDKLREYLRSWRRFNVGQKYKNIFSHLWHLERVYSVGVNQAEAQLGYSSKSGKMASEQKTAKTRSTERTRKQDETAAIAFQPDSVKVVRPVDRGSKGNKSAKEIAGAWEAISQTSDPTQSIQKTKKRHEVKSLSQKQQDILGGKVLSKPSDLSSNSAKIYFTTLGDILDVAITIASSGHGTFDRGMGYLLGPLLENHYGTSAISDRYLFNLAWVPISLKALMGFFAKKVIASSRERYLLGDFIKDLIQDLILPSLGSRCVEGALGGNQEIGTVTFTTKMKKYDPNDVRLPFDGRGALSEKWQNKYVPPFLPDWRQPTGTDTASSIYPPGGTSLYTLDETGVAWDSTTTDDDHLRRLIHLTDITSISPDTPVSQQYNYMLIYVNNFSPIHLDPANEENNIYNGIHYLHLGKIPSIVRGATFNKENIAYLREARAMGQITRTGGVALRDVYRFSCSMYGNNIFKPGMLFFVDPTKDGSADYEQWKDLGIGGFYRVVEVDHAINAGGDPSHITSISAVWETFGSCDGGKNKGLVDTSYVNILLAGEAELALRASISGRDTLPVMSTMPDF